MAEQALTSRPDAGSAVRQIAVAPDVLALSTLARVDYADAFLVEVGGAREHTAEHCARDVLEGASTSVRQNLKSGWDAIGLKLGGAGAEGCVLGWEIRRSTPDHVLLGAESRIGMPGELLFKRQEETLLFATFVQYDHHLARTVWARVEPVHVRTVRRVLEQAAHRSLRSSRTPQSETQRPGREARKESVANADV
jgi:hypothetical protein